jgi:type I restriction enzyme S subunit
MYESSYKAKVDRRLSLVLEVEVDANLQRAERLRQSVLSKAFSGNMVVTEGATS